MKTKNNIAPTHAKQSRKVSGKSAESPNGTNFSVELYKAAVIATQKFLAHQREFHKKQDELFRMARKHKSSTRTLEALLESLIEEGQ